MDACVTTITEMPLFAMVMTPNGQILLQCYVWCLERGSSANFSSFQFAPPVPFFGDTEKKTHTSFYGHIFKDGDERTGLHQYDINFLCIGKKFGGLGLSLAFSACKPQA